MKKLNFHSWRQVLKKFVNQWFLSLDVFCVKAYFLYNGNKSDERIKGAIRVMTQNEQKQAAMAFAEKWNGIGDEKQHTHNF